MKLSFVPALLLCASTAIAQDRALITILGPSPASVVSEDFLDIRVRAQNTGASTWIPGPDTVRGAYAVVAVFIPVSGAAFIASSAQLPLPAPLAPGQSVELAGRIRAPIEPGAFAVSFYVVRHGLYGFYDRILNSEADTLRYCPNFLVTVTGAATPPRINAERGATLYSNDFSAGSAPGWLTFAPGWVVANGVYQGTNTAADTPVETVWGGGLAWQNYTVEVSVNLRDAYSPSDAQVMFRYRDSRNYGACQILRGPDGVSFRIIDTQRGTQRSVPFSIGVAQWFRVRARVVDDRVSCEVIGRPETLIYGTYRTSDFGTAGIRNTHIPVWFDDILVVSEMANNSTLSLTPSALSFQAPAGAIATPRQIYLSGNSAGIPVTISASTTQGNWLRPALQDAVLPRALDVSADTAGLAPGIYRGSVVIRSSATVPPEISIPVSLEVTAPAGNSLTASPGAIQLTTTEDGPSEFRRIEIAASSAQAASLTVAIESDTAGLSASFDQPSASNRSSAVLSVSMLARSRRPGSYSASLLISGSGMQPLRVPVSLTVTPGAPRITISQTSIAFQATAGGSVLPRPLYLVNTGSGVLNWRASVTALGPRTDWLRLDKSTGRLNRPFLDAETLSLSVSTAGLNPGDYYGSIEITSPDAPQRPQSVTVILTVVAAGIPLGPEVYPSALLFTGRGLVAPQSLRLISPTRLTYTSAPVTVDGTNWLSLSQPNGVLDQNSQASYSAGADFSRLTPGERRGAITLLFSDGSIRTVGVLAILPPDDVTLSAKSHDESVRSVAAACDGDAPKVIVSSPTGSFRVRPEIPISVEARVTDGCGRPFLQSAGNVVATLDGMSISEVLRHSVNGVWTGAIRVPARPPGTAVRLVVWSKANLERSPIGAAPAILSAYSADAPPTGPAIRPGAIVNAASFASARPIAPGSIVSLYGDNFAASPQSPQSAVIPTQLGDTVVSIGDLRLPLYYAGPNQVNAQIPYDVPLNQDLQLRVTRGGQFSLPETVQIASAQPAIYTQDFSGSGAGVIVNGVTNRLITEQNPASLGDVVVIYCNGLGKVSPAVPIGEGAPIAGPLSRTVEEVQVRIGGVMATPLFAGLSPGSPGLYQVNVAIPSSISRGAAVPVELVVGGQSSPVVTVAIR